MLKKIRIGISIVVFLFISLYFLDFAEIIPDSFRFIAKIQFIPALLALNVAVVIVLLAATFIFGRVYCSVVCPMGIFQDVVGRIALFVTRKKGKKKRRRYKYMQPKNILRLVILGVTVVSLICGFTLITGLLDPYSAYGRIVVNFFRPPYMAMNNFLASVFMKFGNYTFFKIEVFLLSISALITALVTLAIVGYLAWKHGRLYCNTICPVGTFLSFISRYSIFKVRMVPDKCNSCGLCEMNCKGLCINSKQKSIDYSRCVTCYNCLQSCNRNAMVYTAEKTKKGVMQAKNIDAGKRQFLSTLLTTAVVVPASIVEEKVRELTGGKLIKRKTPITPPGSVSIKHFQQHCTSCHLCISKCPSRVLKPSFLEYGLN
ncbi:MAG: 4Fe-4S binding protein, partial [Prolixibacteraceae bacterium]|nr:4Fe-4S binding protein [Prolixibacteraceae bacterium]